MWSDKKRQNQERTHPRTTKVVQASRKITERRLKWYGHVMRMEEDHVVRRVMTKAIPGKRKRGRPKTRWKDVCKRDMQTVGLREGDEGDRAYWRRPQMTGTARGKERSIYYKRNHIFYSGHKNIIVIPLGVNIIKTT